MSIGGAGLRKKLIRCERLLMIDLGRDVARHRRVFGAALIMGRTGPRSGGPLFFSADIDVDRFGAGAVVVCNVHHRGKAFGLEGIAEPQERWLPFPLP
jgi:hypothetical protein